MPELGSGLFLENDTNRPVFPHVADLTSSIVYSGNWLPIDHGGYCDIHQARYYGRDVAVKVIRNCRILKTSRERVAQTMKKEMRLWSLLDHPNILPFLGYCFSPATPHDNADGNAILSLVSPFMERGNAFRYLREHPSVDRLSILEGLLHGISYLHSMNIVHRDIKGSNVLITESGSAVLADFGVSTFLENNRDLQLNSGASFTSSGTIRGSLRWMAPELVLGTSRTPSKGSDMWSVGCTLMELAILAAPYSSYRLDVQVIPAMLQNELPFDDVCLTGESMHQSQHLVSRLWSVCLGCWQSDNTSRPSAGDVAAAITSFRVPSAPSDIPSFAVRGNSVPSLSRANRQTPGRHSVPPVMFQSSRADRIQRHEPQPTKQERAIDLLQNLINDASTSNPGDNLEGSSHASRWVPSSSVQRCVSPKNFNIIQCDSRSSIVNSRTTDGAYHNERIGIQTILRRSATNSPASPLRRAMDEIGYEADIERAIQRPATSLPTRAFLVDGNNAGQPAGFVRQRTLSRPSRRKSPAPMLRRAVRL